MFIDSNRHYCEAHVAMVYCNICVEMGFHYEKIFRDKLAFVSHLDSSKNPSGKWPSIDPLSGLLFSKSSRPSRGYRHHSSYEKLIRSAALGCELYRLFGIFPNGKSQSDYRHFESYYDRESDNDNSFKIRYFLQRVSTSNCSKLRRSFLRMMSSFLWLKFVRNLVALGLEEYLK